MMLDGHPKSRTDRIRRDVVMRRADAAGGENIGITRSKGVDGGYDLSLDVGDKAGFRKVDAEGGQGSALWFRHWCPGCAPTGFIANDEYGSGKRGRASDPNDHHDVLIREGLKLAPMTTHV
jgi:hypothetical protein